MGLMDILSGSGHRAQIGRIRAARELRERAEDAVQRGAQRHWVVSHDWGSESDMGAQLLAYSVGEPITPERSRTPVVIQTWQAIQAGLDVQTQIEKTALTLQKLRQAEPQSVIHYVSNLAGFGTPGYLYLQRSGALQGVIHVGARLTNAGEDVDDSVWGTWKRSKQKIIYSAASAMRYISLPNEKQNPELARLNQILPRYRFVRTAQRATGETAGRDDEDDNLVIAFALAVYKLQTRGKVTQRYAMRFLSQIRANAEEQDVQPLPPIRNPNLPPEDAPTRPTQNPGNTPLMPAFRLR